MILFSKDIQVNFNKEYIINTIVNTIILIRNFVQE